MSEQTATERLIARDQLIVAVGLGLVTALAWAFVLGGAGTGMSAIAMTTWAFPPPLRPAMATQWDAAYWLIMLAMWSVMMVAMMLPGAAPMILLYARVHRHAEKRGRLTGPPPIALLAAGYLAAWLTFSILATAAQWALEQAGLVHAMAMWSLDPYLTAGLLLAAGTYQLTPAKQVCLEHCRAPAEFLSRHWRKGRLGAARMGMGHGFYCVGCCWALMALLFAGGIMNLVWIAGLAILVLAEKLVPSGYAVARVSGVVLTAAGGWVLVQTWL